MSVGKYYQRQGFSQILKSESADPPWRSGDPAIQRRKPKVYQGDSTKISRRTMRMPSISQEDRARIAQAICSLFDENGEDGFTITMITERVGCHNRKIVDFMTQYGDKVQPQYWAKRGRKNTLTTSGKMIFENLAGNFLSKSLGNDGIPHLDTSKDSPNDISMEERLSSAVDILIRRYADQWTGSCELSYEWGSWPEWFILNRLPWLVCEEFYWPNNRASKPSPGSSPTFGYYRSEELAVSDLIQRALLEVSE